MGNDFKDLFGDWRPEDDGRSSFEGGTGSSHDPEKRPYRDLQEKEVRVVNVFEIDRGNPLKNEIFVLLQDNRGREFRIFVMREVAMAITMAIENERPDRPYTHDLMKTLLDRLGGRVERVVIDDLWQETYYAKITISQSKQSEQTFEIDSRPSDAIAMALRFRAPIYVAESILETAQRE